MATTVHSTNPFISNDEDQQHHLEDEEEEDEEVGFNQVKHPQVNPQQRLILNHHHTNHHLHLHHHPYHSKHADSATSDSKCNGSCNEPLSGSTPNLTNKDFIAVSESVIKVPSPSGAINDECSNEDQRQPAAESKTNSQDMSMLGGSVEKDALENECPSDNADELNDSNQGQHDDNDEDEDDGAGDQDDEDDDQDDDDEDDEDDEDDDDDDDDDETSDESELENVFEPGLNCDRIHQQISLLNHNNNQLPCHHEPQTHYNCHSTQNHDHYPPPPPSPTPHHQLLGHHHMQTHEIHLQHPQHHQEHPLHDTSNHQNIIHLHHMQRNNCSPGPDILHPVVATTNHCMQTSNCADLMDDNLICEPISCGDESFRHPNEQSNFIVNNYEDERIHDSEGLQDDNGEYDDEEEEEEEDDEFDSEDVDDDAEIDDNYLANNDKHNFVQHHQLQTPNNHCLNQRQGGDDVLDGERMLEVTRKLVRSTERDPDRDLRKQVLLKTAIKKLPHFMDYNRYSAECLDQSLQAENVSTQNYYEHHLAIQQHHLHPHLNHNHNLIEPQTQKSSFYHTVQPNAIQMSTTSLRMLDLNDDHEPDANSIVAQSSDQDEINNSSLLEASLNSSGDYYHDLHDSGVGLFSPRSNKRSSSSIGLDGEMEIDNLTELSAHSPNLGSNNQFKKLRKREIID